MKQEITSPFKHIEFHNKYDPGSIYNMRFFNGGEKNSGKSHFVASIPGVFVLDFEKKYHLIKPQYFKGHGWCCPKTLAETEEVVDWLIEQAKKLGDKNPIKFVAIDSVDELMMDIIIPDLTKKYMKPEQIADGKDVTEYGSGGKGGSKGWNLVTQAVLRQLRRLKNEGGYGWVVNGHLKYEKVEKQTQSGIVEVTKTRFAVNPGIYGGLYRQCEFLTNTSLLTVPEKKDKTIKLKNGQEKVLKNQSTGEFVTTGIITIRPTIKDDSTAQHVGSNISMPPRIEFEQGKAWEVLEKAYQDAIAIGGE